MKKVFLLLVLLLILPISVKAEESIKITKVELVNKTETTEVVEEPTFSLKKVNFNLKFSEVGDYAKYKITIKNESNVDYEISNETKFLDNEYIKYEFSYDGSNISKAGEEKIMYINLSYNKQVPEEHFTEDKYTFNNSMEIELVNDHIVVNVPPTYKGYSLAMIALGIVSIITCIILLFIKNKKAKTLLIIGMLILPVTVYALQKISLEIDTKIEIEKGALKVYAINTNSIYKNSSTLQDIGTTYNSCSATGKTSCLKYTIENDTVTGAEVCFIKGGNEYCLKGWVDECLYDETLHDCTFTGTKTVYNANKGVLNTAFTEANACSDNDNNYDCSASGMGAGAYDEGSVYADDDSWYCHVSYGGYAYCYGGKW